MKNTGKIFESAFAESVPKNHLIYRLPDAAQSFGGSETLRFSRKNPFDYLLFDTVHRTLYALELKTVNKKSISFERSEEDTGDIHYHQIQALRDWNRYKGITCGFIIEYRPIETTVFVDIADFQWLLGYIPKKSFTYNDLIENNIPFCKIPQTKKRTRYTYDVESFLEQTHN